MRLAAVRDCACPCVRGEGGEAEGGEARGGGGGGCMRRCVPGSDAQRAWTYGVCFFSKVSKASAL